MAGVEIRLIASSERHFSATTLQFVVEIDCKQHIFTRSLDISMIGVEKRTVHSLWRGVYWQVVKSFAHELKRDPVEHKFFEIHQVCLFECLIHRQAVLGTAWADREKASPLEIQSGRHLFSVQFDLPETLPASGKVCSNCLFWEFSATAGRAIFGNGVKVERSCIT